MENTEIITLVNFNKNNIDHLNFYKKLKNDEDIKKRFQGLLPNLLRQSNNNYYLNKGFLVAINDILVGYIDIGAFNEQEEAVYFRGAIAKDFRGKSYGTLMLHNVADLIFKNYPFVKKIKLKIENDNTPSIIVAQKNGFKWDGKDYYYLENPYLDLSSYPKR